MIVMAVRINYTEFARALITRVILSPDNLSEECVSLIGDAGHTQLTWEQADRQTYLKTFVYRLFRHAQSHWSLQKVATE